MSAFLRVVLSCVGRGFVMAQSPVQGVLSKLPKGFIASEVKSEKAQAREPNL
jgi:hypothetical protein